MASLHERRLRGLVHLGAVTSLSQRNGLAHPTAGPYEATDLQYWWRAERPTDDLPQPVWFDDEASALACVEARAKPHGGPDVALTPPAGRPCRPIPPALALPVPGGRRPSPVAQIGAYR